ncbi:MAG: hypothetical protein CM15mV101_160 [uncultured marine virus]|nr:MAG: hypothetical protein CM15mV101_160 [uncultured marine virus]
MFDIYWTLNTICIFIPLTSIINYIHSQLLVKHNKFLYTNENNNIGNEKQRFFDNMSYREMGKTWVTKQYLLLFVTKENSQK